MTTTEKTIAALKLFNEKAEKLQKSNLINTTKQGNTGIIFSWKKGEDLKIDRQWPDEEAIDSFVLTLRFFIQDNERSSFGQLAELYESLLASLQDEKNHFKYMRVQLNSYLDEKFVFVAGEPEKTNREIFDTFIYGGLAHANPDKKHVFDSWMGEPLSESLLNNRFITILSEFMDIIKKVQKLNTDVIAKLMK